MKTFNHLACVSAVALALTGMVGCTKKDSPEPQAEAEIEVATPEVVDRPAVVCDDVSLKNRVVSLVRDELYTASVRGLGNGASDDLSLQLKARLSGLDIDLQNVSEDGGECRGQLHVVLPNEEIAFANKTFSGAGVASLEEQAIEKDVSLMGGNRLVGDFVFQADGEALAIDNNTPVIALASETMATAVRSMNRQNQANAKRETAQIGKSSSDIVPAPTVQIRPVELPSVPEPTQTPRPEEAILQPEDVPSGTPQNTEPNPEPKPEPKSEPKSGTKPKADTQAQTESKPTAEPKTESKPEPKAEKPASNEITIVETDETY